MAREMYTDAHIESSQVYITCVGDIKLGAKNMMRLPHPEMKICTLVGVTVEKSTETDPVVADLDCMFRMTHGTELPGSRFSDH